jgi:uncharacterized membrane protein YphA (DoxX/SURF4 family)
VTWYLLLVFARVWLGLVFAQASFSKASGYRDFRQILHGFGLSPRHAGWAAPAVLVAEVVVPIGLILESRLGFTWALLVLALFTAAIARVRRSTQDVSCGCFGYSERPVGLVDFARNAVLMGVALVGLAAGYASPAAPVGAGLLEDSIVALAAFVAVVLTIRLADVVELVQGPEVTPE